MLKVLLVLIVGFCFGVGLILISTRFLCLLKKFMNPKESESYPRFSLVFLLKNNEETLEWMIRRLMLLRYGRYKSFEILLIDRGSTDRTLDVALLLGKEYPGVNVRRFNKGFFKLCEDIFEMVSGEAVLIEEMGGVENCNSVFNRIKELLKIKLRSWDQSPGKNKTRGEYDYFKRDDII